MQMTSIALIELDHSRGPSCTRRAFTIAYTWDDSGRMRLNHLFDSRGQEVTNPLPRALRRLRMLMSIHEIPTATIKTLTDGEREVTLEEVIHMRKALTRMLKEGGEQ